MLVCVKDRHVETLVRDVNSHMRQRQDQERLKTIIARIDSYEPIVSSAKIKFIVQCNGKVAKIVNIYFISGMYFYLYYLSFTFP